MVPRGCGRGALVACSPVAPRLSADPPAAPAAPPGLLGVRPPRAPALQRVAPLPAFHWGWGKLSLWPPGTSPSALGPERDPRRGPVRLARARGPAPLPAHRPTSVLSRPTKKRHWSPSLDTAFPWAAPSPSPAPCALCPSGGFTYSPPGMPLLLFLESPPVRLRWPPLCQRGLPEAADDRVTGPRWLLSLHCARPRGPQHPGGTLEDAGGPPLSSPLLVSCLSPLLAHGPALTSRMGAPGSGLGALSPLARLCSGGLFRPQSFRCSPSSWCALFICSPELALARPSGTFRRLLVAA